MSSILLVIGGYLAGSFPFAYLAGRLFRGIDIREYGTRSVGGSNAYEQVGRPLLLVVGLLDIGKAALPSWLALRLWVGLTHRLGRGAVGSGQAQLAPVSELQGRSWHLRLSGRAGGNLPLGGALGDGSHRARTPPATSRGESAGVGDAAAPGLGAQAPAGSDRRRSTHVHHSEPEMDRGQRRAAAQRPGTMAGAVAALAPGPGHRRLGCLDQPPPPGIRTIVADGRPRR